jgi:hypothetical protein
MFLLNRANRLILSLILSTLVYSKPLPGGQMNSNYYSSTAAALISSVASDVASQVAGSMINAMSAKQIAILPTATSANSDEQIKATISFLSALYTQTK